MRNHYSFEMNKYRAFEIDLMIILSNNEISSELLKIEPGRPQPEPLKPIKDMKPLNPKQVKRINKIFLSAIIILSLARVIVILIDKL